mgnify:CR=1 FL=1
MAPAPLPHNEEERLRALRSYKLLDEACDPAYEEIIGIAAELCAADKSAISLVDANRQYFFAGRGIGQAETPRDISFCAHAILTPDETFEIADASKDPRFERNPLVTGKAAIRFYAAQPLVTHDGHAIGALCLSGKTPKSLDEAQRRSLQRLAKVIMELFEARKKSLDHKRQLLEARDTSLAALKSIAEKSKELDARNGLFHSALDNMRQGLCMYDRNQRLIVCNSQYAEMYSLSPELTKPGTRLSQIVQYRIANGIYAGDGPDAYLEERADWGENPREESRIHELCDGRTISISRKPLPDGGWVATHEDISGLTKAQHELESLNKQVISEKERFRSLYRNTPVMMHSINEDGVVIDASEYWLSVMGYHPEEVIGRTTLDFMTEESKRYAKEIVLPSFWRDGYCKNIPYQFIRKDGKIIDVRLSAVVSLSIEDGKRRSLACVIDVTNQVNAERKLAEVNAIIANERERLANIYRNTPVMLHSICEDGEILEVSDFWCKKMGYVRDEVIGHSIYDFMSPVSVQKMRNENVPLLFSGGAVDNEHYTYIRKDGSRMEVRLSAITGRNAATERLQSFSVTFDVTEQMRTERELERHRDHLFELVNEQTANISQKANELKAALEREKTLNEMQRQFVSMVSHEFRTPLAIIDSTAQRIKKVADDDADGVNNRVDKIRNAVSRMSELMESTLTAARLDEGHIGIDVQPCDVAKVIYEACSRHQEIATTHSITCDLYGLPASIRADGGAVDQMLTNLLSNAIKYSPEQPEIHVRAYSDGDNIILQVRDNGVGIDEDDLPKMFTRFFRAKTASGINGTGIGLNLVKRLVVLHGGNISVESKCGAGTTFTIQLPIKGPGENAGAAAA